MFGRGHAARQQYVIRFIFIQFLHDPLFLFGRNLDVLKEDQLACRRSFAGQIMWEQTISNGKLNGIARYFYPNGKLENESYYKDGELAGIQKWFYENSKLKETLDYSWYFKEYDIAKTVVNDPAPRAQGV